MNAQGMLSLQHLIRQKDNTTTYVEYFIMADVDEDDEDESSQN